MIAFPYTSEPAQDSDWSYWNWAASNPWQNLAFVVLPLILTAFRIAGTP